MALPKTLPSGTVLVDFGANSGQVEGKGNQIFQICYALRGGDIGRAGTLGALSANTAYSVTFTYTATKQGNKQHRDRIGAAGGSDPARFF
jgi:hypothetical protein